nr:trehalose-phosphatase [Tessaracoccus coleopterorum]
MGVHTRRSDDPEGAYAALLPRLREIAAAHGLTVEPGRSVIELRSSNVTKGDAIRALVEETGARVVAMCGDDLGDLPAFEELVSLRAEGLVTCRVVSASPEQAAMDDSADILADGPTASPPGWRPWPERDGGGCKVTIW